MTKVLVRIYSEEETYVVEMTKLQADICKKLLTNAVKTGDDWPDKVGDILDKCKRRDVKVVGSINTMGDGWGWYRK